MLFLLGFPVLHCGFCQSTVTAPAKPPTVPAALPQASSAKSPDYSAESFVIEKYATDVTYAEDGTGERILTVQMKVQSDAAVRQLGLLEFPYESRNEHLDFVYVRVRKPDGSVVTTPESDAQDQPAEVTRQAPLYSDLHMKQLPVKALSAGDVLEYQVRQVRTIAAAPGQFWYTQEFLTGAVVLEETASLNVPRKKYVQVESSKEKPEITETGDRRVYRWKSSQLEKSKPAEDKPTKPVVVEQPPSIAVTTFKDWAEVGRWYGDLQKDRLAVTPAIQAKADELVKGKTTDQEKIASIYSYVATQYRYIGVDFGISRTVRTTSCKTSMGTAKTSTPCWRLCSKPKATMHGRSWLGRDTCCNQCAVAGAISPCHHGGHAQQVAPLDGFHSRGGAFSDALFDSSRQAGACYSEWRDSGADEDAG